MAFNECPYNEPQDWGAFVQQTLISNEICGLESRIGRPVTPQLRMALYNYVTDEQSKRRGRPAKGKNWAAFAMRLYEIFLKEEQHSLAGGAEPPYERASRRTIAEMRRRGHPEISPETLRNMITKKRRNVVKDVK